MKGVPVNADWTVNVRPPLLRVALERGHIKCQGKTPEATMASALYTDVKRKHAGSVFTRCAGKYLGSKCLEVQASGTGIEVVI